MGEQRERAVRCERWDPSEIRGLTVMCEFLGAGRPCDDFCFLFQSKFAIQRCKLASSLIYSLLFPPDGYVGPKLVNVLV